jgi:hypothetical protein
MGYRQMVRHSTLTAIFAGSNPVSPVCGFANAASSFYNTLFWNLKAFQKTFVAAGGQELQQCQK